MTRFTNSVQTFLIEAFQERGSDQLYDKHVI